ncbi:TMEM165/GDT1 family protein [Blastomonas sp.]|uniref:TMEM165/GDT1 family protein n=1 Tax=Blastomonas sp. TaxID=1909299 RepID=UPI00262C1934|nr:TMEM165/GDT1 family protein [Blastomonas sp.]MDM7956382.1 TMEM165/GDT1 family protein [Blastomonas sp.]
MEAFLASLSLVALAEMGDKTQLLAILLAARMRKPVPIIAGILVATLANHFLAALLGQQVAGLIDSPAFRYAIAAGFVGMALWALIPDKFSEDDAPRERSAGVFVTTLIAFFLVEMGDKTQVATVAMGAHYQNVLAVTAGTTLGMMIANVPAVLLGHRIERILPIRALQIGAALLFAALGLWVAAQTAGWV